MKKAPYSLHEAEKVSEQFQQLIGQSFAIGSNFVIECVAIAPFDQLSKSRFLNFYFLLNDVKSALYNDYKGLLYDVLIIARSATDEFDFVQEDICTWLSNNQSLAGNIAQMGNNSFRTYDIQFLKNN